MWLWRAAIACVGVLSAACGGEAGIIAEVAIDQGNLSPPDVATLQFAVGITIDQRTYVTDLDSFSRTSDVSRRDLRYEPFRLFVRDEVSDQNAQVMVGVVGYDPDGQPVAIGRFRTPVPFVDGEVRLYPLELRTYDPTGTIRVAGTCFVWFDAGGRRNALGIPPAGDRDCDGDPDASDCGPDDPSIGPTANELCDDDGANSDCDPQGLPSAPEVCNGRDDDCDAQCDEGFDADGDGFTTCGYLAAGSCIEDPARFDCDDGLGGAAIHPDAVEVCDGKDNDCSGGCDDDFDFDGDGFTSCGAIDPVNAAICVDAAPDCAPMSASVYPGAAVPCFVNPTDTCQTGLTMCVTETSGVSSFAPCAVHGATVQVPVQLCSDYAACLTQPEPAYWDCWDTVTNPSTIDTVCSWPFHDGDPCPGPVQVASFPLTTCEFWLIPETADSVTAVVALSGACGFTLDLTAAQSSDHDILTIVRASSDVLTSIFVKIDPFSVDTCPAPSEIQCITP